MISNNYDQKSHRLLSVVGCRSFCRINQIYSYDKYYGLPCLKAIASIRNVYRRSKKRCNDLQSNSRHSLATAVITSTCPAKGYSEALALVVDNTMPPSEPSAPQCNAHDSLMTSASTREFSLHTGEEQAKAAPGVASGISRRPLPSSFDRRGNPQSSPTHP